MNHVFCLFWNVPTGPQRFKSPGQGADPDPSQGPSRIFPTPHRVHKGDAEAGKAVQLSEWTVCPPPLLYQQKDSSGRTRPAGGCPCSWDTAWHISALPLHRALFAAISISSLRGHPKDLVAGVYDEMLKGNLI